MANDPPRTVITQYKIALLKEILRKGIHIASSCTAVTLSYFGKIPTIILLVALGIFYSISETLRQKGLEVPLIAKVTSAASRARDAGHFVFGPLALVIGLTMSVAIFSKMAATCAIFALSFGDGVASLVGRAFGAIPLPLTRGKTAEGSLACFFAVFSAIFFYTNNCTTSYIMALCAMSIELLPLGDFDNVAIPLCVGAIATFI